MQLKTNPKTTAADFVKERTKELIESICDKKLINRNQLKQLIKEKFPEVLKMSESSFHQTIYGFQSSPYIMEMLEVINNELNIANMVTNN